MLKKIVSFLFILFFIQGVDAQCNGANPFCTGTNYSFPNDVNVPDLGPIGCLGSSPNPVWYYMEIDQNGPMTFTINQTNTTGTGIDVDFALWGPYNSLSAGCGGGTFPVGTPIDCSYSTAATETANIPNAQIGQFYILLLTNYANQAGNISFSQTGGTGSADCSFICGVTGFTANPGNCSNNLYTLTGTLNITNPPTSGTLTIVSNCGGAPQVFNAPFGTSINYSLPNLPANGSGCTVSASFSANANCNTLQTYTAPGPCSGSPCSFGNFTGTITNCNPVNNQYTFAGTVNYTNAPTTGTLTLTNSCGGAPQVFNAPFGGSSNFSFTGTANGAPCTITATFSASSACSATLTYPTQPTCDCSAAIGSFTTTLLPSPAINKVCFGDAFSINTNNNFTNPSEIVGATTPGSSTYDPTAPVYDPGIVWLAYSCPPSVAITPLLASQQGLTIPDDPCFVGVVTNNGDITDVNDLSFINSQAPGTFTNNTVYYVPLTMYSIQDGIYSYVVLPALGCYDLGDPIAVQYLPDVTYTYTSNCANQTATIVPTGGSPALNSTSFTASNPSPTGAGFAVNTALSGGNIIMNGLTSSGPFGCTLTDDAGCTYTFTGNYVGGEAAGISYPDNVYCQTDPNPTPTITGIQGGTVTSGPGLSINPTTGLINLSNSSTGSYLVTYTTAAAVCPGIATFNLSISSSPIIDAGVDQTVCFGNSVILNASGGSSYVWSNNVNNGMTFAPSVGVNEYIVFGSNSAGCIGTDTMVVTVIDECNGEEIIFWVPNTFTPDGDQFNQTFKPVMYSGFDPFEYEFLIFNRWGEPIWESHNAAVGWDGSYNKGMKCPDGIYTWKLVFKTLNNDEKLMNVGHVTLIR